MSRNWKALTLSGASLAIVVCATSVILINRASTKSLLNTTEGVAQARPRTPIRNLSLQPEASRVNRRLGNRFKFSGRPESTVSGTLRVGTNQQPVTIVRRQTEDGETVDVNLAGRSLTWSDAEGIKAVPGLASVSDRLLVERLVFDGPDQFVLAQLRGASYYTITRNLRPNEAGGDYTGPLWTLVRLSEPQTSADTGQRSLWRLYYINESTQLIDRVTCELDGQTVEAAIQWMERQGEQVPSRITWTMSGETIMELEVSGFSHSK